MSWCSDAQEDEAISLFAGLLANPDMTLSPREARDEGLIQQLGDSHCGVPPVIPYIYSECI
jgi:hypothetical protein